MKEAGLRVDDALRLAEFAKFVHHIFFDEEMDDPAAPGSYYRNLGKYLFLRCPI